MKLAVIRALLRRRLKLPVRRGQGLETVGTDKEDIETGDGSETGLGQLEKGSGFNNGRFEARFCQAVAHGVAGRAASYDHKVELLVAAENSLYGAEGCLEESIAANQGGDCTNIGRKLPWKETIELGLTCQAEREATIQVKACQVHGAERSCTTGQLGRVTFNWDMDSKAFTCSYNVVYLCTLVVV